LPTFDSCHQQPRMCPSVNILTQNDVSVDYYSIMEGGKGRSEDKKKSELYLEAQLQSPGTLIVGSLQYESLWRHRVVIYAPENPVPDLCRRRRAPEQYVIRGHPANRSAIGPT
jgi:hypothetical protein